MKIVLRIAAVMLAFACLAVSVPAKAFGVSPLKQQVTVAPGTVNQVVSITVRNEEGKKMLYNLVVLGAKQLENGRLVYGTGYSPAEQWVRPEKAAVSIAPGQSQQANFLLNIPRNAPAGSYFLGLAAEMSASGKEQAVGVSGQVVSILLLQTAGVVDESLTVKSWQLPSWTFSRDWPASVLVVNNGTTELPMTGDIIIRDWLGREVYREQINFGQVLLPGSGRKYAAEIQLPVNKIYLPGPYGAEIKIRYGLTRQSTVSMEKVWFVPYYSFVLVLIILAAIIIPILRRKKSTRNNL